MTAQAHTPSPAPSPFLAATLACVPLLCERARHWLHPAPAVARTARRREELAPDLEDLPPGACGWFDSSHELVHGLQIQELTTPESLAAALPLSAWLQLHAGSAPRPS
jgi:hypothetical protein